VQEILLGHLDNLYAFYGEHLGVRIARKHISWYSKGLVGGAGFRHAMNKLESVGEQIDSIREFFGQHVARASLNIGQAA
jgi:tRNA-dihydrouridine synthase B